MNPTLESPGDLHLQAFLVYKDAAAVLSNKATHWFNWTIASETEGYTSRIVLVNNAAHAMAALDRLNALRLHANLVVWSAKSAIIDDLLEAGVRNITVFTWTDEPSAIIDMLCNPEPELVAVWARVCQSHAAPGVSVLPKLPSLHSAYVLAFEQWVGALSLADQQLLRPGLAVRDALLETEAIDRDAETSLSFWRELAIATSSGANREVPGVRTAFGSEALEPLYDDSLGALDEVQALLDGVVVAADVAEPLYATGQRASTTIETRATSGDRRLDVVIHCSGQDGQPIDWGAMPVIFKSVGVETDSPSYMGRLDANGVLKLAGLPAGKYRLSAWPRWGGGRTTSSTTEGLRRRASVRGTGGEAKDVLRAAGLSRLDSGSLDVYFEESYQLRATVERTPAGELRVRFAAENLALAGAEVDFQFVNPDDCRVEYAEKVKLLAREGEVSGERKRYIRFDSACYFVFRVPRLGEGKGH